MGNNFTEELMSVIRQAWSDMEPVRKIGSGAYGSVFECAKRADGTGFTTKEAVKVIKIPRDFDEDYDDDCEMSPEDYFTELKDKAVSEIQIMDSLKGPHVVHINEYKVINQSDQFGFYVLIRMDLLSNLKSVLDFHKNDSADKAERMAEKVCRDMCDALQRCFERNMIHRDIKPENILMSDDGDFYLGDFGLARQFNNVTRNVSSRGTEDYMAPEVFLHGCNQMTDLYSLGLVLYRIVNHNHVLFYDESNGAEGKNIAQTMRVSGQYAIPLPANCSEKFGKIIIKMCAYDPADRFQSIAEIRRALDSSCSDADVERVAADAAKDKSTENTVKVNPIHPGGTNKKVVKDNKQKSNKKTVRVAAAVVIAVFGILAISGAVVTGKSIMNRVKATEMDNAEGIDKGNTEDSIGQSIANLEMIEAEGAKIISGVEDTLGNKYNDVLQLYAYGKSPYVTYYLNGEYSRFVADFSCLEYQTIDNDNDFRIEIYADENMPLYSLDYTRRLAVTPIDIDVTGVEFLTIKITAEWAGKGMGGIMSNGMLYAAK